MLCIYTIYSCYNCSSLIIIFFFLLLFFLVDYRFVLYYLYLTYNKYIVTKMN